MVTSGCFVFCAVSNVFQWLKDWSLFYSILFGTLDSLFITSFIFFFLWSKEFGLLHVPIEKAKSFIKVKTMDFTFYGDIRKKRLVCRTYNICTQNILKKIWQMRKSMRVYLKNFRLSWIRLTLTTFQTVSSYSLCLGSAIWTQLCADILLAN